MLTYHGHSVTWLPYSLSLYVQLSLFGLPFSSLRLLFYFYPPLPLLGHLLYPELEFSCQWHRSVFAASVEYSILHYIVKLFWVQKVEFVNILHWIEVKPVQMCLLKNCTVILGNAKLEYSFDTVGDWFCLRLFSSLGIPL